METADLAFEDELTGVRNRRYLNQILDERWAELTLGGQPVALLIVDLDAFKDINDRHGHPTGDEVLRATARALVHHFRTSDIVARYGGDEFIVLAPGAGAPEARELAERARHALATEPIISKLTGKAEIRVGLSIGVASHPEDGQTSDEVLQAADRRLYEDKRRRGAPGRSGRARRILSFTAGGVLLLVGGLAGSFLTARVRTIVTALPVPGRLGDRIGDIRPLRTPNGPGDFPSPTPLATPPDSASHVAALEARLAELTSGGPAAVGQSPDEQERMHRRVEELEAEIRLLRAVIAGQSAAPGSARNPAASPRPVAGTGAGAPTPAPAGSSAGGSRPLAGAQPQQAPATPPPSVAVTPAPVASRQPGDLAAASGQPASIPGQPPPQPAEPTYIGPRLIEDVRPAYPRIAQALHREASVEVTVTIDERGRVFEARASEPRAGYGFDEAAVAAALRTRFAPARRDGKPERSSTVLRFRFVLD